MNHRVTIYTDGSCLGNPGPGGWAAVLLSADRKHRRELTGFEVESTNNRCELLAAIGGLKALKHHCTVQVRSDSSYLVNGANRRQRGKVNHDLWTDLFAEMDKHDVLFVWLKGHAGHPENERADDLAKDAALDAVAELDEIPA